MEMTQVVDDAPDAATLRLAGGGRKPGVPNKATAEIKALARQYAPAAMQELFRLATKARSDRTRLAAIKELFDRGFGKARQPLIGGDEDDAPIKTFLRVEFI